jgi:small subunit ribosomal protein S24e
MEITILEERPNPLLKRRELRFAIAHATAATPSRDAVRGELSKLVKAPKERVIIERMGAQYGTATTHGDALVYESADAVKSITREHILIRNGLKEKPTKGPAGGTAEPAPTTAAAPAAPAAQAQPGAPAAEPAPSESPAVKPESRAEHKGEPKSEHKAEHKGEPKSEHKAEHKSEPKSEHPDEPKSEAHKPEHKPKAAKADKETAPAQDA